MADKYLNKEGLSRLWMKIKADQAETLRPLFEAERCGPAGIAFFDGSTGGLPLRACVVNIQAHQRGVGTPSPENIRLISGWTGARVRLTKENLWGGNDMLCDVLRAVPGATADGTTVTYAAVQAATQEPMVHGIFKANTEYTLILKYANTNLSGTRARPNLRFVYTDGTEDQLMGNGFSEANEPNTVAFHSDPAKTLLTISGTYHSGTSTFWTEESGLFEGHLGIADFVPPEGKSVAFEFPSEAGTVYGGTLDVLTGTLTVDRAAVDMGDLNWSGSDGYFATSLAGRKIGKTADGVFGISSRYDFWGNATAATIYSSMPDRQFGFQTSNSNVRLKDSSFAETESLKAALDGQKLVYPLANPVTYPLPPQTVKSLDGSNHIWADAGDITVEYGAFLQLLQREIEALAE